MSIVHDIKRITQELHTIRPNYMSNKNRFPDRNYTFKCDDYRLRVSGNYGNFHLNVNDVSQPEGYQALFSVSLTSHKESTKSTLYLDGTLFLYGINPIQLSTNRKIYFNSRMTKEKYFHYLLEQQMPSYEHVLMAIETKQELTNPYTNYIIHNSRIDAEKLKTCSIDVPFFLKHFKY